MKSIIVLLLVFIGFTSQAQNFHFEKPDTTLYGSAQTSTFYGDIDLYNDAGTALNMVWIRERDSVPSGWQTSNCDVDDCHAIGVDTGYFVLPNNPYPEFINMHFYPNGVSGEGWSKIKVVEVGTSDTISIIFYGVASSVGIQEDVFSRISIYPNPSNGTIQFKGDLSGIQTFGIRDLQGKLIETISLNNYSKLVDLNHLTPGMYLIEAHSNKQISGVTRLIIH